MACSVANEARPRVLLVAESCNPDWSSVPLVAWYHSQALAGVADTHLVTQIRNRENILKAGLVEGKDFSILDTGLIEKPIVWATGKLGASIQSGKGWTTQTAAAVFSYGYFEYLLWRRFGPDIRAGKFDIVHRLSPMSPAIPSSLARHCRSAGTPFVVGPLNGGLPWPKEFSGLRAKEREWLGYVREAYKLVPGYRSMRRNASAIIVGSRDTAAQLAPPYRSKAVYIPENAVDISLFSRRTEAEATLPLKLVYVGRLAPLKCVDVLIDAIAPLARAGKIELCIVGDGPEMQALQAQVQREEISHAVAFKGWVAHETIPKLLSGFQIFGFPSIKEFGGAAVLEAMALGLVPVVVDYGGPGDVVTSRTGFAVPMGTREQLSMRYRAVLEQMIADPASIRPMGQRAYERVQRSFTWSAKAAQVAEVYRWVLGRRDKPDFGMPFVDVS